MQRRNFLKASLTFGVRWSLALLMGWPLAAFVVHGSRRLVKVVFLKEDRLGQVVLKDQVYLLNPQDATRALSARCTHLGCTVRHDPVSDRFLCPCHGSIFDAQGRRLKGPAAKDLETLPITLSKSGDVTVTYEL